MGSTFTRYKSPAYVNLDFAPTFTPPLLLKDFDLGFESARELDVPMPVAAAARECVQALVGSGYTDVDFAALIELQARASGLDLVRRGRARARRPDAGAAGRALVTDYVGAYERMLLIRAFEHAMHRLFLAGEVHGTTHLCAGQEAVPVGVCLALEPGDHVAGTYRGHGHALAKGADPDALAAEMLGRATGVCGGRAGSMNVVDDPRLGRAHESAGGGRGGPAHRRLGGGRPRRGGRARAARLDDAWIVATAETPVPYSPTLEDAYMPDAEAIASAVRARLGMRAVAS